jgi:hypothetical protein
MLECTTIDNSQLIVYIYRRLSALELLSSGHYILHHSSVCESDNKGSHAHPSTRLTFRSSWAAQISSSFTSTFMLLRINSQTVALVFMKTLEADDLGLTSFWGLPLQALFFFVYLPRVFVVRSIQIKITNIRNMLMECVTGSVVCKNRNKPIVLDIYTTEQGG